MMDLLRKSALSLLTLLLSAHGFGQTYPQNYFRNPLQIPMKLVANFGEIRTNHWHMGLDIRTQQKVNLPVQAAAEGYVSRVAVEPGGFGQAIYISHPNGFTTVYAHMNAFFPALAAYVKKEQYAQESWRVDLVVPSYLFPLKKGDFIGWSGSTGASEGPHVHFEIRDTKTENCLNPLLFSFPIPDDVPPNITRLAVYDRNQSTYGQSPRLLPLRKKGSVYSTGLVRVSSDKISFAVGAVDRFTGTPNPNGIYSARVMLDGQEISGFTLDNISYEDTRYINAQLDFPYKSKGGSALQHISALPAATDVAYHRTGDGLIHLRDTAVHAIVIEVLDARKNTSKISFPVQYRPESIAASPYSLRSTPRFSPNQVNIFEEREFELFTTESSMYDTVNIAYSLGGTAETEAISSLHQFLSPAIPVHDSITVRIKPTADIPIEQLNRIIIKNISGTRTFIRKAVWQKAWLSARFRQFGTYQAFVDTEPPTVNAPLTDLSRSSRIVFTPRDNFNTIRNFRAELDGKWLRFSNDKGKSWMYSFDESFPRGEHELKVIIADEAGNVLEKSWKVRR